MIHVILGAPCSGKSTFVQEHRQQGDVVIDFDKLAQAFGNDAAHMAAGDIKAVTFKAREAAIQEVCKRDCEAWIIHTKPTEKQMELYVEADAEFIEMKTDMETCLERCERDERPPETEQVIREYFEAPKGAFFMPGKEREMNIKTKTFEVKADNGTISGYASTWTREPDSYGDVVKKGAFAECLEKIKKEGQVLPLLYRHEDGLFDFIGTILELGEDDVGLKFEAAFDDTKEAQRARELVLSGRLCKFSFAYEVIKQETITLDDGREANELQKLNIFEVSLVLYPANPDTSVIECKEIPSGEFRADRMPAIVRGDAYRMPAISSKSGRRNSSKDEEKLRQIIALAQECLGEYEDTEPQDEETEAKSEERDTVNDEEQTRIDQLLKEADSLLTKEVKS